MIELPDKTTTVDLIYKNYENTGDATPRNHLGASMIGDPCKRKLWYSFHWALPANFSGRILRLFERGHMEESIFNGELTAIGYTVLTINPETGLQYQFSDCNKHFGGSMDGAVLGIREAPKTWHVVEYKTCNDKKYKELIKLGCEKSQYKHFAQMQCYMGWSGMERALYLVTNKNDDNIYQERINFDKSVFERMIAKATQIIESPEPLEKIHDDPSWYECKTCEYHSICHDRKAPCVNCRTCTHSTPINDGEWWCEALYSKIDRARQLEGCSNHLFNPKMISVAQVLSDDYEPRN